MMENRLTDAQQAKLQHQFSQLGATLALMSLLFVGIYIQKQEFEYRNNPLLIEVDTSWKSDRPTLLDKKGETMPKDTASRYFRLKK